MPALKVVPITHSPRIVVSLAIVAGLLATPAFAQNLITNPRFDSDTSQSGGDCPTGVGCISGLDCISDTCTGGVCE